MNQYDGYVQWFASESSVPILLRVEVTSRRRDWYASCCMGTGQCIGLLVNYVFWLQPNSFRSRTPLFHSSY